MKIIDCVQGEAEWFEARLGRVTASSVCDAISFLKRGDKKGGETAARAAYKMAIACERLTGRPAENFVSSYMQRGTVMEGSARAAYELRNGVLVETVGFVLHPTIDSAGASPDGLVGDDGLVEIKCPKTDTHVGYMFANELPADYEPQVMFQLACTGRKWCDFVSFDDRLPRRHQLFVKRVYRDEKRIAEIEAGVIQFLSEVEELIKRLEDLNPEPAQFKSQLAASLVDDGSFITDADIRAVDPSWGAHV